ncbi:sulfatase [Verrucomicrobiota bacterium]
MQRRNFMQIVGCGTLAMGASGIQVLAAQPKKPNFLFLLVDDLGWADVGCFGSKFYETPNIDKLASEGMRFTDAYAACPVCSPTRASIMNGKYPARSKITDWIGNSKERFKGRLISADYAHELPLEEITLAEALKEAGYNTFFAGKWHLGNEPFYPEHQGFDINKGGHDRGGPPGGYFSPYRNPRLKDGPKNEHLPDRLASETIKFIENSRNKSFLAYLSFYSVHTPLQGKPELVEKYKKKLEKNPGIIKRLEKSHIYAAMVQSMDEAVGRVLKKLEDLGIADNTIVIFMSDNGGFAKATSNKPLRGWKGILYEGGIREPMIIKWPGAAKPGSECSVPVTSTDFYPTMLEMAGLPLKPKQHIDGISLAPLLKQEKESLGRDAIYWHYPHYNGHPESVPGGMVRAGDYKLIEFYEDMRVELYNLKEDIGEENDLSEKIPEKTAELKKILHDWRKDVGAWMPTPNPGFSSKKGPAKKTKRKKK